MALLVDDCILSNLNDIEISKKYKKVIKDIEFLIMDGDMINKDMNVENKFGIIDLSSSSYEWNNYRKDIKKAFLSEYMIILPKDIEKQIMAVEFSLDLYKNNIESRKSMDRIHNRILSIKTP